MSYDGNNKGLYQIMFCIKMLKNYVLLFKWVFSIYVLNGFLQRFSFI